MRIGRATAARARRCAMRTTTTFAALASGTMSGRARGTSGAPVGFLVVAPPPAKQQVRQVRQHLRPVVVAPREGYRGALRQVRSDTVVGSERPRWSAPLTPSMRLSELRDVAGQPLWNRLLRPAFEDVFALRHHLCGIALVAITFGALSLRFRAVVGKCGSPAASIHKNLMRVRRFHGPRSAWRKKVRQHEHQHQHQHQRTNVLLVEQSKTVETLEKQSKISRHMETQSKAVEKQPNQSKADE